MKILVIGLSNLGDALLTYPALSALWSAYPQAEFHVLASHRTASLFSKETHFKQVWIWDKKTFLGKQMVLIGRLMAQRYQLVIDFRHSLIPLFLWPARRTPIFRKSHSNGAHRALTHLQLVTSLGIPAASTVAQLPFGSLEEQKVAQWIQSNRPLVLMVPGARSHLKRWKAEGFARVADRLISQHQVQVILLGEEAERPISAEVQKNATQPVTDLTGRTTLGELAALLARAAMMITNDSACLHAAEVMGVPTVAIFGPTDEKKYGPRHPRSIVVRRHLVCAPCERALCMYNHECMEWITPEEVYEAAARILEDR